MWRLRPLRTVDATVAGNKRIVSLRSQGRGYGVGRGHHRVSTWGRICEIFHSSDARIREEAAEVGMTTFADGI
jgi:hypothetical protein